MNAATIIICAVLAALFALAIRYVIKNGTCVGCSEKGACHAGQNAGGTGLPSECGGKCSSCQYYEAELKAAAAKHQGGI